VRVKKSDRLPTPSKGRQIFGDTCNGWEKIGKKLFFFERSFFLPRENLLNFLTNTNRKICKYKENCVEIGFTNTCKLKAQKITKWALTDGAGAFRRGEHESTKEKKLSHDSREL
jgi:hypothetical protein